VAQRSLRSRLTAVGPLPPGPQMLPPPLLLAPSPPLLPLLLSLPPPPLLPSAAAGGAPPAGCCRRKPACAAAQMPGSPAGYARMWVVWLGGSLKRVSAATTSCRCCSGASAPRTTSRPAQCRRWVAEGKCVNQPCELNCSPTARLIQHYQSSPSWLGTQASRWLGRTWVGGTRKRSGGRRQARHRAKAGHPPFLALQRDHILQI